MKIKRSHLLIAALFVLGLIILNIWQWKNPTVVEVPTGQAQIDSTAWVQRSAYTTRGSIIDSLKQQNEKLSQKVKETNDQIANYTSIVGKLNLKVDSLQEQSNVNLDFLTDTKPTSIDTSFTFRQSFSDSLFTTQSIVSIRWPKLNNRLKLTQNRPIRLDVANTMNSDRSRSLTYVTSPDFDSLKYQTFTELKPKNDLPTFWIGAGTGIIGTLATFLILSR